MQNEPFPPSPAPSGPGTYTPGYARLKIGFAIYGLLLFATGLALVEKPVRLVLLGKSASAEATAVIEAKNGLPDVVLKTQAEVEAALKPNDYSYIFWNVFEFQTADGQTVIVRAPVGSRLKPLENLVDAEGLPTTATIYYDPQTPGEATFPYVVSTWFAPGALVVIGLLGVIIGSVLWYWSSRSIPLPDIENPRIV